MISNYEKFLESLIETDGQIFWGSIAAGVLIICEKTGRILLNYRSSMVLEPHTWNVYSGKLDDDELDLDGTQNDLKIIEDAAKRELVEETGYTGKVKMTPSYIFNKGSFTFYNFIGLVENEFEPELDWESEGYEWCDFKRFLEIEPKHFGLKTLIEKDLETIKKFSK